MNRLIAIGAMALTFLTLSGSVHAAAINLTFENIAPFPNDSDVSINNYYNGGTSSIGTSGTNYGISFSSNATLLCLNTLDVNCSDTSRGGLGDQNSQQGALFFSAGAAYTINDPAGFTEGVTFQYASLYTSPVVDIWSGTDGTGTLLASLALSPDSGSCLAYNANYCPFSLVGINFAGTAESITFVNNPGDFVPSVPNQLILDDISLNSLFTGTNPPPPPLPEPATWAMMLAGLGLIGAAARRQAMVTVAYA